MKGRAGRILLVGAIAVLLLLVLGRVAVGFYTDVLWYGRLGYLSTYWTRFGLGVAVRVVAAVLAAALVFLNLWWVARHLGPVRVRRRYGNIEIAEQIPRRHILGAAALIAVLGGWWLAELQFGDASVLAVASWLRHVPWGVADPLFGRDVSFYVFALPVIIETLEYLILITVWALALVALGHVLVGGIQWEENRLSFTEPARLHLGVLVAAVIILLGVRYGYGRYLLMVDGHGVEGALGFTDVEARLPAYWAMAGLSLAAAGALLYGAWKNSLMPPVIGLGGLLVAGFLLGTLLPAVVQKFQVEPNELSREAPYIRWNLEFTRRAYGLETMDRRRFPYRRAARPESERLEPLLARLPLWDTEPLERAFNEIQTLFPYYWFPDVDYDRYGPPGEERQVGIAVREFQPGGLEERTRTWQTLRLNPRYIRGMGAAASPAHPTAGRAGAPELWIRNINPVVTDTEAP
ncbi:MAG: hypothetical protein GWM90_32715, partial [Gemmatimonadetes bacterium]|nr:hypothetical protein [Gemmatimonadota bacterium]NIQ60058.1 hypothetical protein [Gemmatimonadota bacterium]NIU80269.1 hypothetical protein [Gammaproteobacteria bacterium]NIX48649.1 hypothetical protein [Gemmatimonadota bacterium]NIY13092.1 hypothetical protein [Gemmatimonadota bacterium]